MSSFKQKTYIIEQTSDDRDEYDIETFFGNFKDLAVRLLNIECGSNDLSAQDEFYDDEVEPYIYMLEDKGDWKNGVFVKSYEGDPAIIIYDFEETTRLKDE